MGFGIKPPLENRNPKAGGTPIHREPSDSVNPKRRPFEGAFFYGTCFPGKTAQLNCDNLEE